MNPALAELLSTQTPSKLFDQTKAPQGNQSPSQQSKPDLDTSSVLAFSKRANENKDAPKTTGLFKKASIDSEGLKEAALTYLDRYDASAEQVRRILKRRIFKHGEDEDAKNVAVELIEEVLQRLRAANLIADDRFALNFARTGRARGYSLQKIRLKLQQRGIERLVSEDALTLLEQEENEHHWGDEPKGELAAALTYVRKKRLTKKYNLTDRLQKNKAMASLGRQGFSFDIALRALEIVHEEVTPND